MTIYASRQQRYLRTPACQAVLSLSFLLAAPAWAQDADVLMVQGRAETRLLATDAWMPATVKQSLRAGSTVRTLPDSQIALLLRDQTQLRLNQNTTLQIQSLQAGSGDATALSLTEGRIWAQIKQLGTATLRTVGSQAQAPRLRITTPTATIGIRGTNWELAVGEQGTTRLTVLSGEVEIANELGSVSVGPNEQAIAERGKAPVKSLLSNARDRVQWVTAYRPAPSRWLPQAALALQAVVADIEAGRYAKAIANLQAMQPSAAQAILLADVAIYLGDTDQAIRALSTFSQGGKGDAVATALHGRALLLAGRIDETQALLEAGRKTHPTHPELLLALADAQRIAGDADNALALFSQVIAAQPKRHEGWFGQGRIQVEKDEISPARQALDEAIRLAPNEPGYQGERATLLALSGELKAARLAFDEALARQPDDYLAWTGLGILQLKTGQAQQALESFLKAGVIEPRFARSQLYAGVAYYQLGDAKRAVEAIEQATELDHKDPLPYLMLALIHGDAQDLVAAQQASQQAQQRMPFLKSANQLLNNQKGSANVGTALANRGLEEWARSYAADAFNPHWAGSAFFLADRYTEGFNKTSELYRGFLLDPLSFGASNRFSSLVPTPGHYASVGLGRELADINSTVAQVTANGLWMSDVPVAYSLVGQKGVANSRDISLRQGDFDNLTVGLGAKPSSSAGLFYFGSRVAFSADFKTPASPIVSTLVGGPLRVQNLRHDIGASLRLAAENHIMLKLGQGQQRLQIRGSSFNSQVANDLNTIFASLPPLVPFNPLGTTDYATRTRERDVQINHSFAPSPQLRISWGIESANERQNVLSDNVLQSNQPQTLAVRLIADAERDAKYRAGYISARGAPSQAFEWQADLMHQQLKGLSALRSTLDAINFGNLADVSDAQSDSVSSLNPRLGVRFSPSAGQQLRFVFQRWRRPLGLASLAPSDTLSIPVEDSLVASGGLLNKIRLQHDWQINEKSFVQWFADHRRVANVVNPYVELNQPLNLTDLDSLRPRKPIFGQAFNELEETPVFSKGRVNRLGLAGNWTLSPAWTLTTRYTYANSKNTQQPALDLRVPYIPRHMANAIVYWQASSRLLVSASATFRSSRFTDELNSIRLGAGWNIGLSSFWETQDKRWSIEAALLNIQTNKQPAVASRAAFSLTGIYRF
jgi:tetratricopeptide (TPR) repeat protein